MKKKKIHIQYKSIVDPVFRASVLFVFGEDANECMKETFKKFSLDDVSEEEKSQIAEYNFKNSIGTSFHFHKKIIIWMPKFPSSVNEMGVIAHELVHSVRMILDDCGIQIEESTDEVAAYMLEYYFTEVMKSKFK